MKLVLAKSVPAEVEVDAAATEVAAAGIPAADVAINTKQNVVRVS